MINHKWDIKMNNTFEKVIIGSFFIPIIIVLILLATFTPAKALYQVWDANVKHVYHFEGNGTDAVGNKNVEAVGSIYVSNRAKYGTGSFSSSDNGAVYGMIDINTEMNGYAKWTLSWWGWAISSSGYETFTALYWDGRPSFHFAYITNIVGYSFEPFTGNATETGMTLADQWVHYSIEWDASFGYKIYQNGVLKISAPTGSGFTNCFTGTADKLWLGRSIDYGHIPLGGNLDELIITSDNRLGAEVVPIGVSETEVYDQSRLEFYDKSRVGN